WPIRFMLSDALHRRGCRIARRARCTRNSTTIGSTPPRITFHEVPGQVMAQIFDDPMKSPLLEAFSKMPASISEADQTNLKNRAARTYKEAVVPAFTKFHQFLISRYLPACREATSAAALPTGAE